MAEVIDVKARFSASVDDAVNNMNRLGKSVNNFGGESHKASSSFLSNIGKISKFSVIGFTAVAGAVGGLVGGMYKLSQMSSSAESHQFRLAQLLRVTGGATEDQIRGLTAQADALSKVGTATKENITQVQSQLATFDLTATTINRLTPAILDYVIAEKGATATTDDFKGMTNGLAQALNGNFGSLTATGFVLDAATKATIKYGTEQERSKALVEVLGSTYLGFNEAIRATPMGQIRAMKTELGDVAQEVGKNLAPVMTSVFGFLNDTAMPLLKSLSAALGETFATGKIGPLLDWLKEAVKQTFDFIWQKIQDVGPKVLNAMVNMFKGAVDWLGANGFTLFKSYVAKLGQILTDWVLPAIPKVLKSLEELGTRMKTFLVTVALPYLVDSLIKMGDALIGWIMPRIPMFLDKLKEFAQRMVTFMTDVALPKLVTQVEKLGDALIEWIGPAARELPAKLMKFAIDMVNWLLQNALPKLIAVGVRLGKALLKFVGALAPDLIRGLGSALFELIKALPRLLMSIGAGLIKLGAGIAELIGQGLLELLKLGVKGVLGLINGLIDKFNEIPVIGNIPRITYDFDNLQTSMSLANTGLDTVNKTMGDTAAMNKYMAQLMKLNEEGKKTKSAFDFKSLFPDEDQGPGSGSAKKDSKADAAAKKAAALAAKIIADAKKRLDVLKNAFDQVTESGKEFSETMTGAVNEALGITVPFSVKASIDSLNSLKKEIASADTVTPKMVSSFKKLADTIQKSLVKALENAKKVLDEAKEKFENFRKSVSDELVKGFGTLTQAYDTQTKAGKDLIDAQKDVVSAQTDSKQAVEAEVKARADLAKILETTTDPEDIAKAQANLADAIKKTSVATDALAIAKKAEEKATGEAAKTFITRMKEQAEVGRTFTEKIKKLIDMGLSEGALQQVLAAGAEAGTAIANELILGGTKTITETNDLITSATTAANEIAKLAATKWYQSGIDLATAQLQGIVDQINELTPYLESVMDDLVEKISREAIVLIKVVGPDSGYDTEDFTNTTEATVAAVASATVPQDILDMLNERRGFVPTSNTSLFGGGGGGGIGGGLNEMFAFAKGGVVTKPTMGLIGEAGAEAVIPLDRLSSMGSSYNITVNAGMGANGTDIGDEIVNALKRYERRNGVLPLKVF